MVMTKNDNFKSTSTKKKMKKTLHFLTKQRISVQPREKS